MKFFLKPRMSSFTIRSNEMFHSGRDKEGTALMERGLKYYKDRILAAINPYAEADAWMIMIVLQRIMRAMEEDFPEAKEITDCMEKYLTDPPMKTVKRSMKPNRE